MKEILVGASIYVIAGSCLGQSAPPEPVAVVPDPGVITTNQTVTPAGIQKIFEGRVYGVSFAASGHLLYATVAGLGGDLPSSEIYTLNWKQNRVVSTRTLPGAPAIQGGIYDPHSNNFLLPALYPAESAGPNDRAQNTAADRTIVRLMGVDESGPHTVVPVLGENEAGRIALSSEANPRNHIALVPLTFNNEVAVIDLDKRVLRAKVKTGMLPFAAVVNAPGTIAYVSNWGGRFVEPNDVTATIGSDEKLVVDQRGIAASGTVSRIDLTSGRVTSVIPVGLHPTSLAWDEKRNRLYVANSNSGSISIVDSGSNRKIADIELQPWKQQVVGTSPESIVLAPDGRRLYVACAGINAVVVLSLSNNHAASAHIEGLIPTGWYPENVAVSSDGQFLAVANLLGVGSGWNSPDVDEILKENSLPGTRGPSRRYVHAYRGSIQLIPIPNQAQLEQYTFAVTANNHIPAAKWPRGSEDIRKPAPVPVPARSGDPSTIEHVAFIIKENRSYDQLFGSLGIGNGDPSLEVYGEDVIPNHRRLARQFVLLDNFYATGGNSADGHQWVTQANETDYAYLQGYNVLSYPKNGDDPMAFASGGFLWDDAISNSKSFLDFGEFAGWFSNQYKYSSYAGDYLEERKDFLEEYKHGEDFSGRFHTVAPIRSLNEHLATDYPSFGLQIPDVVRAKIFLEHLKAWEHLNDMPNLVLLQLPSDHTIGTTPGVSTPAACLADNDLALGQIVDGLSHSKFWKSLVIFVVEDDAQYGLDHVDGHRTVALAISPYIKRGTVDSTFYSQTSMVKTIELILGLQPLSLFDLIANDMRPSFQEQPDLTPYQAVTPRQSIYQLNPPLSALRGSARIAAAASARMNFQIPDAAPAAMMNEILWHNAKGWDNNAPRLIDAPFRTSEAEEAKDGDGN